MVYAGFERKGLNTRSWGSQGWIPSCLPQDTSETNITCSLLFLAVTLHLSFFSSSFLSRFPPSPPGPELLCWTPACLGNVLSSFWPGYLSLLACCYLSWTKSARCRVLAGVSSRTLTTTALHPALEVHCHRSLLSPPLEVFKDRLDVVWSNVV